MTAFLALSVMAVSTPAEALPPTMEDVKSRMSAASPGRAPAAFVLPDLAHDSIDISMDWFVGRVAVNPAFRHANRTSAEAHIRTVFPLPNWLEIGFIMGLLLPTASFERDYRPNLSAARAAASLDPTSYPDFLPGRFGLRPAGDLRIRRDNLIFQGRHGIDILFDSEGIGKTTLTGRLLAHVGYLARPDLEVALEGSQFYFFATTEPATSGTASQQNFEQNFTDRYRVKDGARSAIAIGPTIRVMTRDWDYGVALSTNIADPLSPVADGFLGIRFSIIGHVRD